MISARTAADNLKQTNPLQFYNSITLLGEYYHRARIAASPVKILGHSLLQLLTDHLRADVDSHQANRARQPDVRYLKLILRQVTLNGQLARDNHRAELDNLLVEIRRCLVLVDNLCANARAFLLMTLDLYYRNFGSLGEELERLYVSYLMDTDGEPHEQPDGGRIAAAAAAVPIGLHAHTVETVVHSINGLGNELSKQGSGYQRPTAIKTEFLNRPLKASERLRFVRQQTATELDEDNEAFCEKQRAFEQTVEQQQRQRQTYATSIDAATRSPIKSTQQQQPPQPSPQHIHSPRSAGERTPQTSAQTTPTKTPTARRRPVVVPVSPLQHSDWFAEVESNFAQGQQAAVDQLSELSSPQQNRRNFGNGSPNKYSKSVSPNAGVQHNQREYYENGDGGGFDGENKISSDHPLSPSSKTNRRRGGKNNRKNRNNRSSNLEQRYNTTDHNTDHNGDNESLHASKTSLQSGAFRQTDNQYQPQRQIRNKQPQNQQHAQQQQPQSGRQLKPANRNNAFEHRSKHSQHCDRADGGGEQPTSSSSWHGYGNNNADADQEYSPPQNVHARNPHAAQYAKEFLEFLDD